MHIYTYIYIHTEIDIPGVNPTTQARGATLALPLPPFAEQLSLGFNPSPAAAVGGGCRYARGGRFAHL